MICLYFIQVHESHIETNIVKSKMEIDPTTQMDAGKWIYLFI